ncbi:gamma-glutamylcyclotransferase [Alteromonas oceanisediminis]|uniref:gamma-glutamylcyclotransferase n=1 Tax=Alteromonas oceanisediminis TaxID=2836180 RepID=UPI001BDA2C68|nr:gamma-glutamylcyclotransferase [Alteromonas oceanisediminis]MBT0585342.1 gamma-glutamylcyclotransferase [Alteromonas oceanisediminis]
MHNNTHPDWQDAKHFLLGYGSLLSDDSRFRFSQNPHPAASVLVDGFRREWITRSEPEQQTYVGAIADATSQLNAHCIPVVINPSLQQREQDYRFVQVSKSQVSGLGCQNAHLLAAIEPADVTLWLCESLLCQRPTAEFPIHQTYIDTCLSGSLQHGGIDEAWRFMTSTAGWDHIVNDRDEPRYPRAARVSPAVINIIDQRLMPHITGQ